MYIDKEHLQGLDPKFDFKQAFKQSEFGLINIFKTNHKLHHEIILDGQTKKIEYPETLYKIMYRQYGNESKLDLEKNTLFSSIEALNLWVKENIHKHFTKVTEEEAFEIAQKNVDWLESLKLNKKP